MCQTCLGSTYSRLSCKLMGSALRQRPSYAACRTTTAGFPANDSRLSCKLQQAFLHIFHKCVDIVQGNLRQCQGSYVTVEVVQEGGVPPQPAPFIAAFRIGAALRQTCGVGLAPVTHNYSRLSCRLMGPALRQRPSSAACRKPTAGIPANCGRRSCKLRQAFLHSYSPVALQRLSAHELLQQAVSEAFRVVMTLVQLFVERGPSKPRV